MRLLLYILLLICSQSLFSQEDFLAKQYFEDGAYDKAVVFYEKLVAKNPMRTDYGEGLIACYQQLEQYDKAEQFLLKAVEGQNIYPTMLIELGYNYTLQDLPEKATEYYNAALQKINENPNFGYGLGYRFQKYALLDYAIKAYSLAMEINPQLDYNFQKARIYGEQGNIEQMYDSYLKLISEGKASQANVLRNIDDFISSDAENPNNIKFKKVVLQNAQKNPDILWNELLSWLFVQQKQYKSAFSQEKAIYKRGGENSLQRLQGLGKMALEEQEIETAKEIFEYISQNSADAVMVLDAQLSLIDIDLLDADDKVLNKVQGKFDALLGVHGYEMETLQLQIAYANFLTFNKNTAEPAIEILRQSLELPLNNYGKSYIKSTLGDILVYDQKFNQALIYFSQIQKDLKNDVLGQEARFKVAQTSFYKGDFDWALTQLKVLRGSTSQLIANDAMQLSLLISDNSLEDSTQTALKKYARADFLAYQNKKKDAVGLLEDILQNHKGEKIEDEALMKQAQILTELKDYEKAEFNYLKIVEFYANDILADDANFALAELYRNILNLPEKAKAHYEKIIYNYQDSYYFPQARKNFRMLRGDSIN
ncbi:tetratricopeptide repeat protein [Arenibacter sp. BSSL-BM3]|uniref:Tetratricopeptide repeat protein n=1 Tax=Arenibacter arenosicollis TaxID=2762274 RepID=A0ABR7QQ89_9FLAO|nr:tetratricopeptide repeat protein [Arenibacter arenosicollis]MBC8769082.1 tetratricopeptide repeat protein [Arenibacter arenosicollis]